MRRSLIGPRTMGLLASAGASLMLTLGLGLVSAQDQPPEPDPKGAAKAEKAKPAGKKKGPVAPAGAPPKKGRPNAGDPLRKAGGNMAKADNAPAAVPLAPPTWPFHFQMRIAGADGAPLAVDYYPARTRRTAPVVLLIHDRGAGRSGKDFSEPLEELKGKGMAETLQEQGYAVIVPDLRGHGRNPRHEPGAEQWRAMTADLQSVYLFLVDRHNREELNLAKLGVIAIGDGANLVAAWAATPGAAVSSEGRIGDLSGLALLSPVVDSQGLKLQQLLPPIAPRIPILLLCGDRDGPSVDAVKAAQPIVERHQRSKVSYVESSLHGTKLLQFIPKVAPTLMKYLDDPVKARVLDWEPRFLFTPVQYESEGVVETAAAKKAEPKAAEAPAKAAEAKKKAGN